MKVKSKILFRFIVPIIIGILIGTISGRLEIDYLVRILNTISDNILAIISIIAPLIIFSTTVVGIANIRNNKIKFLLQFFSLIIISLFLIGIIVLIISYIIVPHLALDLKNMESIWIDPYFSIGNIKLPGILGLIFERFYTEFYAVILGIFLGIFLKKKSNVFKSINKLEINLYRFINKVILPIMPIWILGSFAATGYSNQAGGFFITDFLLSILILILQGLLLIGMYFIVSMLRNIKIKEIFKAGFSVFGYVVSISGVGTSVVIPFIVNEQKKLLVDESKAQTITATSFNMPGSLISNIVFIVGVMALFNYTVPFVIMIKFLILLIFLLIISPSIPGGVVAVVTPWLSSYLHFSDAMIQIFTTMYYKQGISNSATNNSADLYMGVLLGIDKKKR